MNVARANITECESENNQIAKIAGTFPFKYRETAKLPRFNLVLYSFLFIEISMLNDFSRHELQNSRSRFANNDVRHSFSAKRQ